VLVGERLFWRMIMTTGSGRQGGVHDVPHSVRASGRATRWRRGSNCPEVPLMAAKGDDVPSV
jgi:hypothetical protein